MHTFLPARAAQTLRCFAVQRTLRRGRRRAAAGLLVPDERPHCPGLNPVEPKRTWALLMRRAAAAGVLRAPLLASKQHESGSMGAITRGTAHLVHMNLTF